jgi:hypothetical protein
LFFDDSIAASAFLRSLYNRAVLWHGNVESTTGAEARPGHPLLSKLEPFPA